MSITVCVNSVLHLVDYYIIMQQVQLLNRSSLMRYKYIHVYIRVAEKFKHHGLIYWIIRVLSGSLVRKCKCFIELIKDCPASQGRGDCSEDVRDRWARWVLSVAQVGRAAVPALRREERTQVIVVQWLQTVTYVWSVATLNYREPFQYMYMCMYVHIWCIFKS